MKLKPKEKGMEIFKYECEICVMCGEPTFIPVSLPIEQRENYIIGCGQLCSKCAKKMMVK